MATEVAKELDFGSGDFREFKCSVTLTLTLDHLENHIVRFVSSTSIHIIIVHMAPFSLIVNGGTGGQTFFHKCEQVIFAKSTDDLMILLPQRIFRSWSYLFKY